jgi:coenzyme Q-binding protein COQ10
VLHFSALLIQRWRINIHGWTILASYEEFHHLPFPPEQLFDLVADVERYPEFLPEYRASHIRRREGDTLYVDQRVGLGGFELVFQSVALLERPARITIRSRDHLFRQFEVEWRFASAPDGCRLAFRMNYRLGSRLLEGMVGRWLDRAAKRTVAAFVERARALFA